MAFSTIRIIKNLTLMGILLGVLWGGRDLSAQVTCTGAACEALPENIRFQLNQLDTAIQAQYTDRVLQTMTEAAVLGNINSAMMGPGIVNRFQIGGGFTLSGQKKQDVDIISQDLVFRGLPNVGASVAPNINVAFNLGWLMGYGPSDTVTEYSSFLHRFNVYLHGFQYNFAQSDVQDIIKRQDDKIELSGDIANYGFMIRFHVVPNYSDGIGIFEFSGISIGTGVHYQRQNFGLIYNDPTSQSVTLGPSVGTWGGFPALNYKSSVTSIPLDVRTGFRMFYVMTLFVGLGTSLNFGQSTLDFQKQGPLSLRVEDALISGNLSPEIQAALANLAGTTETGTLSVALRGRGNAPNNLSYVVGGVELNIGFVKLLFEAMASKNIQSANVGIKIAF